MMGHVTIFTLSTRKWPFWPFYWQIYSNFRSDDQFVSNWLFMRSVFSRLQFEVSHVTLSYNSQKKLQETIGRFLISFCRVITDMINRTKMAHQHSQLWNDSSEKRNGHFLPSTSGWIHVREFERLVNFLTFW